MSAAIATFAKAHAGGIAVDVVRILRTARLPVNTEAELQIEVANLLDRNGIIFRREVKIAGPKRIDFLVGYTGRFSEQPSVGLEIKIKGGKRAIHRQCADYCRDPRISQLIVLSGMALGLPPDLSGKRVTIVNIGSAWL